MDNSVFDDEEDMKCIICFDNWTNLGEHSMTCLKCGHVFGKSCIRKWIEANKNCPTCKVKCQMKDLWNIFPNILKEGDNEEIIELEKTKQSLKEEIEKMREEVDKMEKEISPLQQQELDCIESLNQLKDQIKTTNDKETTKEITMYKHQVFEVNKEGGCRVLDYSKTTKQLFVSLKSKNLFGETYRLQKVDVSKNISNGFIVNHSKPIRDVKCHETNDIIATVSLDNFLKITDLKSNETTINFNAENGLWCCEFDLNDTNLIHVGKQQGSVLTLDLRNTNDILRSTSIVDDYSPVVSINSLKENDLIPTGALVFCKLNSAYIVTEKSNEYVQYLLPIEGPFMSSSYLKDSGYLLFSTRPNSRFQHSRHLVCSLTSSDDLGLGCNTLHAFPGSFRQIQLTRSCLFSCKSDYDYVAAYNQGLQNVLLYSVDSGEVAVSLVSPEPVIDICHVEYNSDCFLACLTEKKVQLNRIIHFEDD